MKMSITEIKVSIIIPVYNVKQYLRQCLDSLIYQTHKNIEIICVNDGSYDGSREILQEYQDKDSRIIVIDQINQGQSKARNLGLKYVSGKYIMYVDSDDWIETNTCELAVNAAESENADLVFWSYIREFEANQKVKLFPFWEDREVFDEEQVKFLHRRICGPTGKELGLPDYLHTLEPVWGKLYLAQTILDNQINFVDLKEIGSSEDGLFNLYALNYVKKAIYLKKGLYHYRKTNNSTSSKYRETLIFQWQHLFQKMKDYISVNNLPNDYYIALNNRIALSILDLGLNINNANCSIHTKIYLVKDMLKSEPYKSACQQLPLKYFPLHWKIFYGCAKYKCSLLFYLICKLIKKIFLK